MTDNNGLQKNQAFGEFLQKAMKSEMREFPPYRDKKRLYFFDDEYLQSILDNFWDDSMRNTLFARGFEVFDYHYEWMYFYFQSFQSQWLYNEWNLREWEELDREEIDNMHDEIISELEPDLYTGQLLQWYASRIDNPAIMDEALEQYRYPQVDAFQRLQIAQLYAMTEIYEIGRTILLNLWERIDDKL